MPFNEHVAISSFSPLLLFLLLSPILVEASVRYPRFVDSIYNFGDSFSDTGNFVRESPGGFLFARYPYGMTARKATGRLSDGLLMIDFFAKNFGVPLLPPYLNKAANFSRGANFAVAGATALDPSFLRSTNIVKRFDSWFSASRIDVNPFDPWFIGSRITVNDSNTWFLGSRITVNPYTNSSLRVQLDWFQAHKKAICSSKKECIKAFKNSLFFVGEIGGNDFLLALISRKTVKELTTYVPSVVNQVTSAAQEVIEAGASRLIIPGIIPLGCTPFALTAVATSDPKDYDEHHCLKDLNKLTKFYNRQLKKDVGKLKERYPYVDIKYADYYTAFSNLLKKADLYGFNKSTLTSSCCGAGGRYNFDGNRPCGLSGTTVCQSPSKYIFWDGIHLTQEANRIMAMQVISHGLFKS